MAIKLDPHRKLLRARIQLQNKAYFIYHILFYAKYKIASTEEVAHWPHKTACANSIGDIAVAADYIKDEDDKFVESLLYHEAVHLVLMHPILGKNRIRELWNISADVKVSQFVIEGGYNPGKDACVADYKGVFKLEELQPDGTKVAIATVENCDEKSSIRIYDELYEQLNKAGRIQKIIIRSGSYGDGKKLKPGDGNGEGSGSGEGEEKDGEGSGSEPGDDDNEKETSDSSGGDGLSDQAANHHGWEEKPEGKTDAEISKELRDRIREAYTSAKARGNMPAGLARSVEKLLESKTDWRFRLKKTIISAMPYEQSYRLPDKRSYATGVYMPHIEKESADVIISIDTSKSIGKKELTAFLSELVAMSRQCHNLNMEIIICDAEIHEIYPIKNGNIADIMAIKMKGGGGTSHVPVFEYCKKYKKAAKLLINFTDGFTAFPEKKDVNIETLWVLTKNSIAPEHIPFGLVIRLETA